MIYKETGGTGKAKSLIVILYIRENILPVIDVDTAVCGVTGYTTGLAKANYYNN